MIIRKCEHEADIRNRGGCREGEQKTVMILMRITYTNIMQVQANAVQIIT